MDVIPAGTGSGSITCSVPMCYRVVASVVPPGMVLIRTGTNTGTDPDMGAYNLSVDSFCMDKYEATKSDWDSVRAWAVTNGYTDLPAGAGKAADHPVQAVSWHDAVKWCNARSQMNGREPSYYKTPDYPQVYKTGYDPMAFIKGPGKGYRLPTRVEWEYAARGGMANQRFPWGDVIDHTRANYYSYWSSGVPYRSFDWGYQGYDTRYSTNGVPYTSPVGAFGTNGYGLCDIIGNVSEWCNDVYPEDAETQRTFLGGSWDDLTDFYRIASPNYGTPWLQSNEVGFRCVLTP
jgi:formylglycine-generating enzyme required for sulfatase activity